jgi:hypothetical protein
MTGEKRTSDAEERKIADRARAEVERLTTKEVCGKAALPARRAHQAAQVLASLAAEVRLASLGLTAAAHYEAFPADTAAAPSALVEFGFGWNRCGDDGAAALARALPRWQLEVLDLAQNHIGPSGAVLSSSASDTYHKPQVRAYMYSCMYLLIIILIFFEFN